ncbi:hypothetical protein Ddc_04801 [Ditylenchus destructor]|nr:hypothetical protein Ddc_04801 [Ditylenchus destructor]
MDYLYNLCCNIDELSIDHLALNNISRQHTVKMDKNNIRYGIVIENFPEGEVGTIVLDLSDHLLYKVPMTFVKSKEERLKVNDNVIFCTAPESNIIAYCEHYQNFHANNNSLQVEETSILMHDTVFFSNENPPRVYSFNAEYIQFEREKWSSVMTNVPYKAVIEMNINYGMDFIPAKFKLATFNPTVEFWLLDILSVDMHETESVQQMEWNRSAENNTYVVAPTAIVDDEKFRKDTCIVLESDKFYSSDGTVMYNPLPGSWQVGSYGPVTYYRSKFNNNVRVAGKFQELGQVPIRQSSSGIQFLLDLGARRNGFYSNVFIPIVGDPKCLLYRIDTKSSPKQAWVNYDSRRDIFRKFTVVELPQTTTGMLDSIDSFGFVKNSNGEVYCPEHFDVEFRLSKDLMGKHKLGDFIEFTAIFRPKKNSFVIKTTDTGARYKRLTVGTVTATNGRQSYAFHVPLGRVSNNMLQSDAVGLVEDPSGLICQALFGYAPVELALRTFWVAFEDTGIVPLRVITEKDKVTVAEIKDNVMLYLELPRDYYDSDDEIPKNPMLEKLVQRFG